MLALVLSAHAFNSPSVHVAQPVVRASPVQMMEPELPSRRATLLSAASLLALPLAAQAKPEDYYGGCALGPLFSGATGSPCHPISLCWRPFRWHHASLFFQSHAALTSQPMSSLPLPICAQTRKRST